MIWQGDLVVLVADSNMQAAVRGLFSRPESLGIRPIQFNIFVHVERDPGCFHRGHDFLRSMAKRYEHGLILFDRIGSGQEDQSSENLEKSVNARLSLCGWNERAATIVLDPELEVWVWAESPEVGRCLGWKGPLDIQSWLSDHGMWPKGNPKPENPKKAVELVLRYINKPRSSSIYQTLAENVSFQKCVDAAFRKFKEVMQNWFPRGA